MKPVEPEKLSRRRDLIGNSQTGWTTVPLSQFRLWQASFVREDGLFMFFGLLVATAFIALLDLRRSYRVDEITGP